MNWIDIQGWAAPLTMPGLLSFMQRWRPGSATHLKPATPGQIAALVAPHGGENALPSIYLDFLEVMGESLGDLSLLWGTTSISALLEELESPSRERADPRRFLKFGLGADDYNGRHPDDFFDLTQPTPDGRDAAVLRIHEPLLARGTVVAARPFSSFSDLVRRLFVAQLVMVRSDDAQLTSFNFGDSPRATAEAYEIMTRIGFQLTELGASTQCIPLEDTSREAFALLKGPSGTIPGTRLQIRTSPSFENQHLTALLNEHSRAIRNLRLTATE